MKVEIRRDFSVKIVICYLLSALLVEGDSMDQEAENSKKKWTRAEVETALKEILIDALDVDEGQIVPDASLVHDLGTESIDFLDIGFRVQQTFDVELPNRAIQDGSSTGGISQGCTRSWRGGMELRSRVKISRDFRRWVFRRSLAGLKRTRASR